MTFLVYRFLKTYTSRYVRRLHHACGMRRCIAISLTLVMLLLFSGGCNTGVRRGLNVVGLIDFSGSLPPKALERYIQIICHHVMMNLDEVDRLVILPIDEGAKKEPTRLVFDDMSQHQFSFPTDGFTHAQELRLKRVHDYVNNRAPEIEAEIKRQKEIRKQFTYQSDILSAIEQAAKLERRDARENLAGAFGRFVSGKKAVAWRNVMVIFSDMIQESSEYSFASPEGPDSKTIPSIVKQLKGNGRLPDMSGWVIFVDGRTGSTNRQIVRIQDFWVQYFKAAGGELRAYDYDVGNEIGSFLVDRNSEEVH